MITNLPVKYGIGRSGPKNYIPRTTNLRPAVHELLLHLGDPSRLAYDNRPPRRPIDE